jgi:hypothetical protein
MKHTLCIFALLLGFSTIARAQYYETYQPDSVVIVFDTVEQPLYNYGGVFTLSCQYDSFGLLTHSRYESASDVMWKYTDDSYSYDNLHNCTRISTQYDGYDFYDVMYDQKRYTYNDNVLTNYGYYIYDMHYDMPMRSPWICYDSIAYAYDEDGRIAKETVFYLSSHVNDISYEYFGKTTTIITEGYPNGSSVWQVLSQRVQTFSDDGLMLTETKTGLNQPSTRKTYSYTEGGKLESVLSQQSVGEDWVNTQLLQYTFNADGQLILAEIKRWENDDFVETFRAVYEINDAGYPTEVVFEKRENGEWTGGSWKNGFYVFSEDHLERQNDILCRNYVQRVIIHYATTQIPDYDVEEHQTDQAFATLHPNPANSMVTITGKNLKSAEVLNMLGQRVAKVQGQGETLQVDIAKLPAGVYFVNVTDAEGRKCVRKVVKE